MKKYFLSFAATLLTIIFTHAQVVTVATTNALCNSSATGTAKAIVTPPGNNYQYTWSANAAVGVQYGDSVSSLPAGTYSVTVTDTVTTMQYFASGVIAEPAAIIAITTSTNVSCNGNNDGAVASTVTGGIPPYTYLWSNNATTTNLTNLTAGSYSVSVSDANNCATSSFATVTEPAPITISPVTQNPSCNSTNGTIDLNIQGGTPPYSFMWSNGSTANALLGVAAGTYTVSVLDANGCNAFSNINLSNSSNLSANATIVDIDCQHITGSISAVGVNGILPYSYAWYQNSTLLDTGSTFKNLQPGNYTLEVTDGAGCVILKNYTVNNLGINAAYKVQNLVCNTTFGSLTLLSISGGSAPYSYSWSNGATTASLDSLAVGTYSVTVSDAQTCTSVQSFSLVYNQFSPNYYVLVNGGINNCASTGTLTASVPNGVAPFTYLWNNGATTASISNIVPGAYAVTVTDANGCSGVGYGSITPICLNTISGYLFNDVNANCNKDSGDVALVSYAVVASNGSQFYYGWSDTAGFYSIAVPNGNYSVTINNYYGCTQQLTACGNSTAVFNGTGQTSNHNFTTTNNSSYDLSVWANWTKANPGFNKNYNIYYGNNSGSSFNGTATITMHYDSVLVYVGSNNSTPVHNASAHTLTWTINNISSSYYTATPPLNAEFNVPVTVSLSAILHTEITITPTANDCNTSNNTIINNQIVTGSYDPNKKEVFPDGNITNNDSILTYTIHFQNTGTDTTHFVILVDSLPAEIYPSSVTPVAFSHLYKWLSVTGLGGVLKVEFNPIYLVDSATNEPASKGFFTFTAKKKPALAVGTQIKNKAYIYFDYNPPIITNTVINTIVAPSSIVEIDKQIEVKIAPYPFSVIAAFEITGLHQPFNFELFDITGKRIREIPSLNASKFFIAKESLSTGMYLYRITSEGKVKAQGRVSVQ